MAADSRDLKSISTRIRQRRANAAEHLADKSPGRKMISGLQLSLANTMDASWSVLTNGPMSTLKGFVVGALRGGFFTAAAMCLLIAGGAFSFAFSPLVLGGGALLTAGWAVVKAVKEYNKSILNPNSAAALADKFAERAGAVGPDKQVSKVVANPIKKAMGKDAETTQEDLGPSFVEAEMARRAQNRQEIRKLFDPRSTNPAAPHNLKKAEMSR